MTARHAGAFNPRSTVGLESEPGLRAPARWLDDSSEPSAPVCPDPRLVAQGWQACDRVVWQSPLHQLAEPGRG